MLPDPEMNGMLQLTADERDWLAKYRQTLRTVFPGLIEEIVIFGIERADTRAPEHGILLPGMGTESGAWERSPEALQEEDRNRLDCEGCRRTGGTVRFEGR